LPSAAELGRYLARRVNFPEDEASHELGKVADYFRIAAGRSRLRRRLRDIFGREYPYGPLHELLARVPAPLLSVTTNYDDLLERALRAAGRPFDLVIHPTDREDWAASVLHRRHGYSEPEFVAPKRRRRKCTWMFTPAARSVLDRASPLAYPRAAGAGRSGFGVGRPISRSGVGDSFGRP
jgi:hypothetical protein